MTKIPGTIITPAQLAADLSLTGLFLLGVSDDASRYNHATGASGTVTGTLSHTANTTTFDAGEYIDTGVAETSALTLFVAAPKLGYTRAYVGNINGENEMICGLLTQASSFNSRLRVSGNRAGAANEFAHATIPVNEALKSTDNAISFIGRYPVSGQAHVWEPGYRQTEATGTISGSGVRVVVGTNYRIGAIPEIAAGTGVHAIAIANYAMTDAQMATLFAGMSKILHQRGVYL